MNTHSRSETYLIVGEIRGLCIPCSMEIKNSPKTAFYLYPGDYCEQLKKLKEKITQMKSDPELEEITSPPQSYFIEKQTNASTFIVAENQIDIHADIDRLIPAIYEKLFNPILNCLSLFFEDLFRFHHIWFFEKDPENNQWHLTRLIQMYLDPDFPSSKCTLRQFAQVNEYEIFLPSLISRLTCEPKYDSLFNELSLIKTQIRHVEVNILLYWMMLEHLTQYFFQDKKGGEFLEKKAFSKFKKKCAKELEMIEEKDIYYKAPIQKLLDRLENYPPIKDQIDLMYKKIKYKKTAEEDRLIKLFYNLRSEIVHNGFNEFAILKILQKSYPNLEAGIGLLTQCMQKFEMLIEKIFLKVLGFSYFLRFEHLQDKVKHQLLWRDIPQWQRDRLQDYLQSKPAESLSNKDFMILLYENEIKRLQRKPQYIPIIEQITNTYRPHLKSIISEQPLKGRITSDSVDQEIEIQFQENLQGTFKGEIQRLEIGRDFHGSMFFCENISPEFPFSTQFTFFPIRQESVLSSGTYDGNYHIPFEGSFRAFSIDFKRVV